jgi:hypothetical protein
MFYSPMGKPHSTLDAEALHCRVRNGNGCYLLAMITGKTVYRPKSEKDASLGETTDTSKVRVFRHEEEWLSLTAD